MVPELVLKIMPRKGLGRDRNTFQYNGDIQQHGYIHPASKVANKSAWLRQIAQFLYETVVTGEKGPA